MTETAKLPIGILTLDHGDAILVTFSFFHNPPLTPPAKTLRYDPSERSHSAALDLPAASLGPSSYHGFCASPGTASGLGPFLIKSSLFLDQFYFDSQGLQFLVYQLKICSNLLV